MSDASALLQGIRDPQLAVYATSSMPAWLWSIDGTRVLWSNSVAAQIFGARNAAILAEKPIGPADPHRRQIVQLASQLSQTGAARMERLRGFGAPFGRLLTCACSRLTLSDGTVAILVAATEGAGRTIPINERVTSLLNGVSTPSIAFSPDGSFAGANDAAKIFSTFFNHLTGSEFDSVRETALRDGEAAFPANIGRGSLHRVGAGSEKILVALIDEIFVPERVEIPPTPLAETPAAEAVVAAASPVAVAEVAHVDTEIAHESLPTDVFGTPFEEIIPSVTTTEHVAPLEAEPTPAPISTPVPPETVAESVKSETPVQARATDENNPVHRISATLAEMDGPHLAARRHPLRFMWQMDEHSRFSLGSDEFSRLIGSRTAAAFGRLWSEIAQVLGIDPEGKVAAAVATRGTWSNVVVEWPADGSGARLPVELSGLPVFDRAQNFIGYRGFGVCRDIEALARLAAQRRDEILYSSTSTASKQRTDSVTTPDEKPREVLATDPGKADNETQKAAVDEASLNTPQNVLPFRQMNEPKPLVLTPGESVAFDELGRRLSAGLDGETTPDALASDFSPANDATMPTEQTENPKPQIPPAFLQPEAPPPRVNSAQDTQLIDRLPVGVLVYRLDRLLYANRAFLERAGFANLHELTEAGGLDALFVEPGKEAGASTSEAGASVVISATKTKNAGNTPSEAKLFAISWDNEPAMALMFSSAQSDAIVPPPVVIAPATPPKDSTQAEELSTILDTTAEGIVMFDGLGRILSCNKSAEALFSRSSDEIAALNLIDLFAPESQRTVLDHLENAKNASIASLLDHGRDILGRVRDGRTIPLSMTMGRTRPESARFFAVFRDLSQVKKSESELVQARRQSERATMAKSDVLGRISHEVRMPLNAIIGFADVMIEERFGPLGNERYVEYMKDIRTSGQRVMTIIDDLLDLSRIESGKIELAFVNQDLNNLIEQCVAVMQPQANRERIIIRTSLAHALPSVKADARALRQIAMNLIGSSIHLANAGGQVIVSTATTDFGDIALRVRDTGPGLNDNEIAAAMAPFRTAAATDHISSDNSAVSLSLTKALVEANKAKFNIKTAPHSGTLIEVVFSHASAIA